MIIVDFKLLFRLLKKTGPQKQQTSEALKFKTNIFDADFVNVNLNDTISPFKITY